MNSFPAVLHLCLRNGVGWARTYLKQAGLIRATRHGAFQITDRGKAVLNENPGGIDPQFLERFEDFRAFRERRREASGMEEPAIGTAASAAKSDEQTPEDRLASAYQRLREELELELLEQIKACSPAFFERLVVDVLVAMGYGGSRRDAGRAVGKSGDGGIDGIIKEDKLGLDVIFLQAKRWEATIGRPEIQKFAGALQGQRANKGVFITTSTFTREAADFANAINTKIILISGLDLVRLMIDHNVGVSTAGVYELKKLDSDYFEES